MPLERGGTKETGWLSKWAFQVGALAADVIGRQAVEDKYIQKNMIDDIYLKQVEIFQDVLAASATVVRSNEDVSAAIPLTFTIDLQPDVPRNLAWAFDSHAQVTAFTLIITGTDAKGSTITDTFTQADGWAGATEKAYATITSIIMTARTGTGAGDTVDIGVGSIIGLANNIDAAGDVFKVKKNNADLAAADYTAEAVNDTVDVSTGGAIVGGDDFTIWYKTNLHTIA